MCVFMLSCEGVYMCEFMVYIGGCILGKGMA